MLVPPLIVTVPCDGVPTAVMVSASPSASVLTARGSNFRAVLLGVVSVTLPATGAWSLATVTFTVAVAVPPLPSEMV